MNLGWRSTSPPLNYGETARPARLRQQLEQAQHLARVLRAVDDDVHVVYVSPWNSPRTSSTTTAAYYRWARLGVAPAGRRCGQSRIGRGARNPFGETSDDVLPGGAFTVVVPELSDRIPVLRAIGPSMFVLAGLR